MKSGIAALVLAAFAQTAMANPAEHGITDLQAIPTPSAINRIPDFAPDGRDAMIVKAYDNSSRYYLVMLQSKYPSLPENSWNIVLRRNRDGRLVEGITDNPHTGEDYVTSIAFARAKVDGEQSTLLIEANRNIVGPIPDPAIVTYSVYRLERDTGAYAGDIDIFRLITTWDSTRPFCNSELALNSEFGFSIPVPDYLSRPDGCTR